MGFETSPFGKADNSNVLEDVSNHFGQRDTGGTEGIIKTEGLNNEYNIDVVGGLGFPFPVLDGVEVTGVDETFLTAGNTTALTIGGVDVIAATESAPVNIPAGNTGVIVQTGGTAGSVVVKFKRKA